MGVTEADSELDIVGDTVALSETVGVGELLEVGELEDVIDGVGVGEHVDVPESLDDGLGVNCMLVESILSTSTLYGDIYTS